MSDELPEVAVRAGAEAIRVEAAPLQRAAAVVLVAGADALARAVLLAAIERIECPKPWMNGHPSLCVLCRGSGVLHVLKRGDDD